MFYAVLLTIHIAGGVLTGIVASCSAVVLWRGMDGWYRACTLTLSALATFEILSGVALAIISIEITAQSLCTNIALYLSAVCIIETLLFFRMKKLSLAFPLAGTLFPVMTSLLVMAVVVAYGF